MLLALTNYRRLKNLQIADFNTHLFKNYRIIWAVEAILSNCLQLTGLSFFASCLNGQTTLQVRNSAAYNIHALFFREANLINNFSVYHSVLPTGIISHGSAQAFLQRLLILNIHFNYAPAVTQEILMRDVWDLRTISQQLPAGAILVITNYDNDAMLWPPWLDNLRTLLSLLSTSQSSIAFAPSRPSFIPPGDIVQLLIQGLPQAVQLNLTYKINNEHNILILRYIAAPPILLFSFTRL